LIFSILILFCAVVRAADPGITADLAITKTGPANISAGDDTTFILTVTSNSQIAVDATVVDTLPAGWTALSATPSNGSCAGAGAVALTCTVNVNSLAPVTITIAVHVPGICQPATAINQATVSALATDPNLNNNSATTTTTVNLVNLGPGLCHPPGSQISDDKPGSLIIYNLYTSGASNASTENNTRINLTNTNTTRGVAVHLFFVDGTSCGVADAFVCLTANQTVTFLMSDIDPGTTGYMIAIAVDGPPGVAEGGNTGCPISFNYLIGNANIKLTMSPRREADLAGESVAAGFGSPLPGCDANSSIATLPFDGSPTGYNRLPRVLAVSNIPARADGNSTLLVINRIGGNLATGAATLGTLFGILYDDNEIGFSFSLTGSCQLRGELTNTFPRTTPRLETIIPAGRSGWMKISSQNDIGLVGAVLNQNRNAGTAANAFDGGHNLHKLTLTGSVTLTIPVFPPSC
jgi:hypothetical protein